jgi:hypothetical protein
VFAFTCGIGASGFSRRLWWRHCRMTLSSSSQTATFPLDGDTPHTRYGAGAGDLASAAGVLRARATAGGVTLLDTSEVDLAAAVIAADAWLWTLNTGDLRHPATHGPGAVAVLAAALARAAGHRRYITGTVLDDVTPAVSGEAVELIDSYRRWATSQVGAPSGSAVLRRAAADLSAGHGIARAGRELELVRLASLIDALSTTPEHA